MNQLLRDLLVEANEDDLRDFRQLACTYLADAGRLLYQPGEIPRGLSLVVRGRIAVERDGERVLEFGTGSYFGERALMADEPTNVHLVALEPIELLEFAREPARRFLHERPAFGFVVIKALFVSNLARLSATNQTLSKVRFMARTLDQRNQELSESLARLAAVQEELIHAKHLAAIGTMVAGIAHEINNPLAYAIQSIRTARDRAGTPGIDGEKLTRPLDRALEGAERVRGIVQDVLRMGRSERVGSELALVDREITAAMRILEERAARASVIVELDGSPPAMAAIAPTRLGQILMNLIGNAIDASPPGKKVFAGVTTADGWVSITVRDEGHGMPEEVRSRIFDPFFTTKPVGKGSGLGLWICQSIITQAGGTIEVASQPGQGSVFTVRLPAVAGEPSA